MPIRAALRSPSFFALGVLLIALFFDAGVHGGGHRVPRLGVDWIHDRELVFMFWYGFWGVLAVLAFSAAFRDTLARPLLALHERVCARPDLPLALATLWCFVLPLLARSQLLLSQPVADDELAYELSARNLALGRITSAPPIEPAFLHNQFVVVDASHWHGKYPLGHSLLLAPFELIDRVDLLGGLLAAGSFWLAYAVARSFLHTREALCAALLLALSPHFLLTHATLLSQTSSTFMTLLAAYLCLREPSTRWQLVGFGACAGAALLTRPMPSALIVLVLGLYRLGSSKRQGTARMFLDTACWLPPLVLVASSMLLLNVLQFGTPWTSGYSEVGEGYGFLYNKHGEIAASLGGALTRENLWLLGWPCTLPLLALARIPRRALLFWSLLGTGLVYRVLLPKTVVSTTGPIYMTESVPYFCMALVAGLARARRWRADAPEWIAAATLASFVVASSAFLPVQLRAIALGARARDEVFQQLRDEGAGRALVFADVMGPMAQGATWANYPPNPWPDLRDHVLFLRIPAGEDGRQRARELARTRFADRRSFELVVTPDGASLVAF